MDTLETFIIERGITIDDLDTMVQDEGLYSQGLYWGREVLDAIVRKCYHDFIASDYKDFDIFINKEARIIT